MHPYDIFTFPKLKDKQSLLKTIFCKVSVYFQCIFLENRKKNNFLSNINSEMNEIMLYIFYLLCFTILFVSLQMLHKNFIFNFCYCSMKSWGVKNYVFLLMVKRRIGEGKGKWRSREIVLGKSFREFGKFITLNGRPTDFLLNSLLFSVKESF